uniref:Band 7 domain-containing protein n=1 Tax=Odontella aurita TaxID=265563 RepID=A0A6U6EX37_9STRA|mmetsp:Transcript_29615/g.87811  ORF Transcript_29615/g.87811 Transcript_29615/m.87811 type:complete len:176 (+) Transcript_29615:909-1436(+)
MVGNIYDSKLLFLVCQVGLIVVYTTTTCPLVYSVFVTMGVTVQFRVIEERAYDAFYRLSNIQNQIRAYVFDVIRSTIPRMELDSLFVSTSDVALDVLRGLQGIMHQYGYEIIDTLVTDISPNPLVRAAMNEIMATRKIKEAMFHKAEAGEALSFVHVSLCFKAPLAFTSSPMLVL